MYGAILARSLVVLLPLSVALVPALVITLPAAWILSRVRPVR